MSEVLAQLEKIGGALTDSLTGKAMTVTNSSQNTKIVDVVPNQTISYTIAGNMPSAFIIDVRGYNTLVTGATGGMYNYGKVVFLKKDGTITAPTNLQPTSQTGTITHNVSDYDFALGSGFSNGTITLNLTVS